MTNPDDPTRWDQPHQPAQPPTGQPPQEPVTGSTVSYNAAAFDEDDHSTPPSSSGSYPSQPVSGSYPSQPVSGSYPSQPTSGSYPSQPTSGAYPTQPASGSYPAQPASGAYPAQPSSGTYPAQSPDAGGFDASYSQAGPPTGGYQSQPMSYGVESGSYPAQSAYAGQAGYPAQSGYAGQTGYPSSSSYPAQPGPYAGDTPKSSSSKKPLLLGLGALLLVGLLVIGYFVFFSFSGIHNTKGDIKNAKAFLSEATSEWKDSLPEDGITVSKDAGCYYVLNSSDDVTNQIACGPARRAASAKGAVWDYFHYNVAGSGDQQTASDLTLEDVGMKEPSKGSLVTADGDGPEDDGADLKEPPLPKAEKDGVWSQDQFVVDEKSKGNAVKLDSDPRLVAPGAQVLLTAVTEYSMVSIDGKASQAADGQKLFVVELTGDSGPVSGYLTNTLSFDLNGTKVEVDGYPDSLGSTQILVSVPTKGTSNLVLDSEGHQQTLNLANGERAEDKTTEMYYSGTPELTAAVDQKLTFPGAPITPTEVFMLEVTLTDASIRPYDPDLGWAPAGQVWLIVKMSTDGITSATTSTFQYYDIDCNATSVSGATTKSCYSDPGGSETATYAGVVAPGTKQFSMNFSATLDAWGDAQPHMYGGFGPAPVAINFP